MQTRQRVSLTHNQTKGFILPYIKETTDRISRILNKHNIRTTFKPLRKIRRILRNPKNQRPPFNSAGVYKISYFPAASIYTLEKPEEWSIYG